MSGRAGGGLSSHPARIRHPERRSQRWRTNPRARRTSRARTPRKAGSSATDRCDPGFVGMHRLRRIADNALEIKSGWRHVW